MLEGLRDYDPTNEGRITVPACSSPPTSRARLGDSALRELIPNGVRTTVGAGISAAEVPDSSTP
jgi:hypothetical protein